MEAAIGSLLAGGCVGGIGMLLKSSAASQNILADAMARTDTTPVNDVRSHLITSGLNSTQSEMYGETYSAQPITYKERPCLVKKEITLRVYKTHIWVQPNKDPVTGEELQAGYWRKEQRSQVSCSRRADPTCRLTASTFAPSRWPFAYLHRCLLSISLFHAACLNTIYCLCSCSGAAASSSACPSCLLLLLNFFQSLCCIHSVPSFSSSELLFAASATPLSRLLLPLLLLAGYLHVVSHCAGDIQVATVCDIPAVLSIR